MSDANDAMIESLIGNSASRAEIRAGLDKAWATVQEMTAVALRDEAVKRGEFLDG